MRKWDGKLNQLQTNGSDHHLNEIIHHKYEASEVGLRGEYRIRIMNGRRAKELTDWTTEWNLLIGVKPLISGSPWNHQVLYLYRRRQVTTKLPLGNHLGTYGNHLVTGCRPLDNQSQKLLRKLYQVKSLPHLVVSDFSIEFNKFAS